VLSFRISSPGSGFRPSVVSDLLGSNVYAVPTLRLDLPPPLFQELEPHLPCSIPFHVPTGLEQRWSPCLPVNGLAFQGSFFPVRHFRQILPITLPIAFPLAL
jgi:hypothetical protein